MTSFDVTILTKEGGPLTKRISLSPDGSLVSDGSACVMSTGTAKRFVFEHARELAKVIGNLAPHEAIAAGRLREDLPSVPVRVTTKRKLNGAAGPVTIARTRDYIDYRPAEPAFALLDFDKKGMPGEIAARIETVGGIWQALIPVVPDFKAAARVVRQSTSAGLYRTDTGEQLAGSGGMHIYLAVCDGADIERFLKTLHQRCWLVGLGWLMLGAGGQLLERSVVDRVVGTPERLIFEGAPLLIQPVAQDPARRRPAYVEGDLLNTETACPPLTAAEHRRYNDMLAAARTALAPVADKARSAFVDQQAKRLIALGVPPTVAMRTVERQCEGILLPDLVLPFDDHALAGTTVADVLADPAKFEGETLADPLEGVEYGTGKAKIMRRADGELFIHSFAHGRTLYELRGDNSKPPGGNGVGLGDFYAYMPMHKYIFAPAREVWPSASVNARIPQVKTASGEVVTASLWLDKNQPVEQMTWAPGFPMIIGDRLNSGDGWVTRNGVSCFNLYRPPTIVPGNAEQAGRWVDHVHKVFPDDALHIINWLAQRVQRPQDKINHALVLGSRCQGIGKDTILEPIKAAVGPWNFKEVSPTQLLGRFNEFLKSVILRISEARDLGDFDRFKFYDHLKAYTAAQPDVLRVDEKHLSEYSIMNVCGLVITTNHKNDGIYLPAEDRRHYVAWSERKPEDFSEAYWTSLYGWYAGEGARNIAAFLAERDLSSFDSKAPPPKTEAFWEIVNSARRPEDAEMADALEVLGWPDAVTIQQVANRATEAFAEWLCDRKNARQIPHRLEECGYVAVRYPHTIDGRWKVNGKNQVVYAKAELPVRDRYTAAQQRAAGPGNP
jgi:Family of unknown function (DUF5906)